jgi:hypothetical protein
MLKRKRTLKKNNLIIIILTSNSLTLIILLRRSPRGTFIIYMGGAIIRGKHSEKRGFYGGFAVSEGGQFWELEVAGGAEQSPWQGSTWPRTRALSWH